MNHCVSTTFWAKAFDQSSYDNSDVSKKLLVLIQADKKCFQLITFYIVNILCFGTACSLNQLNTSKWIYYDIFFSMEVFNSQSSRQKQSVGLSSNNFEKPFWYSSIFNRWSKGTDYNVFRLRLSQIKLYKLSANTFINIYSLSYVTKLHIISKTNTESMQATWQILTF